MGSHAHPTFFGSTGRELFGHLHWPHGAETFRSTGAVICGPLGYEAVPFHRTIRHLATALANRGVPTLRFDYRGTGDAAGERSDDIPPADWVTDVETACAMMASAIGMDQIILIGIRLGSLLATHSAQAAAAAVWWAPVAEGRRFAREWRTLAAMGIPDERSTNGSIEAAGYALTGSQLDAIAQWSMPGERFPAPPLTLVVERDDRPPDGQLAHRLASANTTVTTVRPPGFAGAVAEPHYTEVPHEAIRVMSDWVAERAGPGTEPLPLPRMRPSRVDPPGGYRERIVATSTKRPNHGIVTEPSDGATRDAVVFLNAGAVPRVGPNRMYVAFSRALATRGVRAYRFDVGGIGDSPPADTERENDPYAATIVPDVHTIVEHVCGEHQPHRLTLVGLCSGAFAVFHAGLDPGPVTDVVMINPLTFYWEPGMTLDQPRTEHYAELAYYRSAARDPAKWGKLLMGRSNIRSLVSVLANQLRARARKLRRSVRRDRPRLARDLARLQDRVHPWFVFARGDPGWELLHDSAGSTFRRLVRAGTIGCTILDGADHTFSGRSAREELGRRILDYLSRDAPERQ